MSRRRARRSDPGRGRVADSRTTTLIGLDDMRRTPPGRATLIASLTLPWALWAAISPLGGQTAPAITGRLVDGEEMLRSAGLRAVAEDGFSDSTPRVPLAETPFTLTLMEGPGRGASWQGKTDAEGRFSMTLGGLNALPSGKSLVASVAAGASGRTALYSLGMPAVAGAETEFRMYGITEDPASLFETEMEMIFTIATDPATSRKLVDVRVNLSISNVGGNLFVGRKASDQPVRRAVFRIPLPEGFRVTERSATDRATGEGLPSWTITPDGWAVIDSPVPPFPEARRGVRYRLRYQAPAFQEMTFPVPVDIPLTRAIARCVHLDMSLTAPAFTQKLTRTDPDPDNPGGPEVNWDYVGDQNIHAGHTLAIGLTIDSLVLRQFNRGALKVVGGLVIACLVALLVGLMLGRSGPRVEAVLSEATGEEIIERIAQLDAQFEKKRIPEADYRETRSRLLSLARYEVPELAQAASSGSPPGGGQSGPAALPERVRQIAARVQEIESEGSGDAQKIQERLLLLEDLARAVRESERQSSSAGEGTS